MSVAAHESPDPGPDTASRRAGHGRASVLLVSDDAGTRSTYCDLLDAAGYHVMGAATADALRLGRRNVFDMVILETGPASGDPAALIEGFTGGCGPERASLLVVTDPGRESPVVEHLETGLDDYLLRPIDPCTLRFRLACLERTRAERAELASASAVLAERARMWTLLLELSRSIASAGNLDTMIDRIVLAVARLTGSRRVALLIPEDQRRGLAVAGCVGTDPAVASRFSVPLGTGHAVDRAYDSIDMIFGAELAAMPATDSLSAVLGLPTLVMSLRVADRVVGVVHVGKGTAVGFTDWEVEFIDVLRSIAATAIDDLMVTRARDLAQEAIVAALATLGEYRDNDTGRHVERVTQFSLMLARALQEDARYRDVIDAEFLVKLRRAVPLHDIGKVAIPDSILLKPGKLSPAEIEIIRTHAPIGRDTVRAIHKRAPGVGFLEMAEEIAAGHHERFDGNGYPDGVAGTQIPLAARIVAIADVYDAITSWRVYKDAMPHDEAVAIILEGDGTQFDPEMVTAFRRCQAGFASLAHELTDDRGPGEPKPMPLAYVDGDTATEHRAAG